MLKRIKYIVRVVMLDILIVGVLVGSSCYASSFWDNHSYDFSRYAVLEAVYAAARNCVWNGDWKSYTVSLGGNYVGDSESRNDAFNSFKDYINLHNYMLFEEGGTGQMASHLLESIGTLADPASSGAHDGLLNCYDTVNVLDEIVELFKLSGGGGSIVGNGGDGNYAVDKVENLVCNKYNKERPGLLKLSAGWMYDDNSNLVNASIIRNNWSDSRWFVKDSGERITDWNDPRLWPDELSQDLDGNNCNSILSLFKLYDNHRDEHMATLWDYDRGANMAFAIRAELNDDVEVYNYNFDYTASDKIADNGPGYFEYYMRELLGGPIYSSYELGCIGRPTSSYGCATWSDAIRSYWKYYLTFNNDAICANIGAGSTDAPLASSSGKVGIYDPSDQYVHFLDIGSIHKEEEKWILTNQIPSSVPVASDNGAGNYPNSSKRSCGSIVEELRGNSDGVPSIDDLTYVVKVANMENIMGCIQDANEVVNNYQEYYSAYDAFTNNIVYFVDTIKDVYDGLLAFMGGSTESSLVGIDTHIEAGKTVLEGLEPWLQTVDSGVNGRDVISRDAFHFLYDKVSQMLNYVEVDDSGYITSIGGDVIDENGDTVYAGVTEEDMSELLEMWENVNAEVQNVTAARDAMNGLLAQYSGSHFSVSNWQNLKETGDGTGVWEVTAYPKNLDSSGNKAKSEIKCPFVTSFQEKINEIQNNHPYFPGLPGISDWTPTDSPVVIIDVPQPGTGEETSVCYANSGTLGWILCPVIEAATGIGQVMWNSIEGSLRVPASEVFVSGGGVEQAWEIVRNIANVAFIGMFLFVIFSQLTGVGIDNYGIKKILPKLIVVAVLINISYFLCKLAVDISNLLGVGLNSLLTNFSSSVGAGSGAGVGYNIGSWLTTAAIGTAGVGIWALLSEGGLGGVAASIGLAVFGLVISVVVAILFLYVILGVRMAGVILGIVLAPVAIACYALPNTNKLYKKWFDIFKAVLVVYPICGAMVGAGKFAGAILSRVPSMGFIAMIVQVAPFFFVPTLLKGSLAMMGNVGAKLSTLGKNIGRRGSNALQSGIRNTEGFKNRQQSRRDQVALRRAQRVQNRLRGRNLNDRQRNRLAAANRMILEKEKTMGQNDNDANMAVFHASRAKQNLDLDESANDIMDYGSAAYVNAQRTKSQNARAERRAEAAVGVHQLNQGLAMSRARARRNAQELRAYQDQYVDYDKRQLLAEANSAGTWLSQAGGAQRMSALISAMEANGMERDIFGTLQSNNVSNMSSVMSTLATSKNKVLRAYGKKGAGVNYNTFMNGTGANSLQGYIGEKGVDFLDGLDDKALAEISNYNNGAAMGTDLLIEAAARINGQDAVNEIDKMLSTRSDISGKISAEQLINFNDSTVNRLITNRNAWSAMGDATNAIASSPELIARLKDGRKQTLSMAFGVPL